MSLAFGLSLVLACANALTEPASNLAARSAPSWVRDGVVYEVFPRAFSPSGDLRGVTARLDEIHRLGATILWIMPVQPIGREKRKGTYGSPYSIQDYDRINPDYGTEADFKKLVAEAHRRGLRVILDVVANHTSWDSVLMSRPEFYLRDAAGKVQPPSADWNDVAKLDYANPEVRRHMTAMLARWLRDFDLDGFRCDVAGLVPTDFWVAARRELQKIKPDLFLLAEWSEPGLMVEAFDVDYAWPFHRALNQVLFGAMPASALRATWEEERRAFPRGSLHLRFSDNHDERRALARFGEQAALAAAALVLSLDGVPLIYNGMETGDTAESGGPALTERVPILWATGERRPEFLLFFTRMIALRRAHEALRQGETLWLSNSDESRVLTFRRSDGLDQFVVAVNLSSLPWTGTVGLPEPGQWIEVTPPMSAPLLPGESKPTVLTPPPAALPLLSLGPWGFRLFQRSGLP
ncbi:MAG TPA: alpha-amylase family glycosyl hydrolase [Vicinamibacteria bacterium]